LALGAPLAAQAAVWTVGGPGGQFADIQSAIHAASDGDVILVQPGFYGGFTLDAKALVLAVDGDSTARASIGAFEVRNLGPGQSCVIRNFTNSASVFGPNATSQVWNCAGPVLLEDCEFFDGDPTLRVGLSAAVTLARCSITGFTYQPVVSIESGHALNVTQSAVHVYDCQLVGADGKDGVSYSLQVPLMGEPGAIVDEQSFLYAAGTIFRGGAGGDGAWAHIGGCVNGANGGAGLVYKNSTQSAYFHDCVFQGGVGGAPTSACLPGNSGWPAEVKNATYALLSGRRIVLSSTSPLREGQSGKLELLSGQPFSAFVFASPLQQPFFNLPWNGTWLLVPPLTFLAQPSAGQGYAAVNFSVGELGPGVLAAPLFVQAAVIDGPTLTVHLSGPTHVLLLDSSL
jgi:hypothetical protein